MAYISIIALVALGVLIFPIFRKSYREVNRGGVKVKPPVTTQPVERVKREVLIKEVPVKVKPSIADISKFNF